MRKKDKGYQPPKAGKPKSSGKKSTIIIGGLAIIAVLAVLIIPRMKPKEDPSVGVTAVTQGDLTSKVDTSGTVESLKTKTYFSPVNATVKQCSVKEGESVKAGTPLVTFNTDTLEQDNKKAQLNTSASINGSQDTITKAQDTIQKARDAQGRVGALETDVNNYQNYVASLKTAISDRTRQLTENSAQVTKDISVALTQAQADLAKTQQQLEKSSAQQTQLQGQADTLAAQIAQMQKPDENGETADTTQLEKQLEDLKEQIKNLNPQIEQLTAQAEEQTNRVNELNIQQIESQGTSDPTTDAQIVAWQNEMESASTELADLQSELAEQKSIAQSGETAQITDAAREQMNATNNISELEASSLEELLEKGRKGIQAEFSGIIAKTSVVEGAPATQGLELITIASNEDVAINVTISKYDYDKIKEGQKAEISIADNSYQGTVDSISKIAKVNEKGSPIISAQVKVDNPDDNIFLGVEAKVSIETASAKNALRVPVNAVNTGKDSTFCYVVKDGVVARQDVKTGISSTEYTEILEGLKPGDSVIPELPVGITEGMKVNAVGADQAAGAAAEQAMKE